MDAVTFAPHTLDEEYRLIQQFTAEHNFIHYFQLDHYTTQKVNLFALPEQERFYTMEFILDKIIAGLPALKKIFSKPITRLKDVTNLLPIEAVRVINNATIVHVSSHTELWGNVSEEGLKPRKLMSLTHEEEYKIYENIAFVRLIDSILSFVKKNTRMLKDIMYSCQPLRVNLLERTNHLMHFLAVGKLHVGYAHVQDKYHQVHQRCLEKLLFIDKTLRAKLHTPVYRICKKDHSKLTLKKTNVFRLQKEYRQVYSLLKLFAEREEQIREQRTAESMPERGYADYCTLLSLFAIGHFNFTFHEEEKLDLSSLKTECQYKKWILFVEKVSKDGVGGLRFQMKKEKTYTVCLLFYRNEKITVKERQAFEEAFPADEYLTAEPIAYGEKATVYLNLFDIDSFRRIQQFLLRAMVYADEARDVCPFCGTALQKNEHGYECALCKTLIKQQICKETQKSYFTTELKDYKIPLRLRVEEESPLLFLDKETEAALFYRNITPLSTGRKLRCPHCGKVHK